MGSAGLGVRERATSPRRAFSESSESTSAFLDLVSSLRLAASFSSEDFFLSSSMRSLGASFFSSLSFGRGLVLGLDLEGTRLSLLSGEAA